MNYLLKRLINDTQKNINDVNRLNKIIPKAKKICRDHRDWKGPYDVMWYIIYRSTAKTCHGATTTRTRTIERREICMFPLNNSNSDNSDNRVRRLQIDPLERYNKHN